MKVNICLFNLLIVIYDIGQDAENVYILKSGKASVETFIKI